eukprot:1193099-Prorocentrum_minimum.AAC.1
MRQFPDTAVCVHKEKFADDVANMNDKVRTLTRVDMYSGGLEAACGSAEGEQRLSDIFKVDVAVSAREANSRPQGVNLQHREANSWPAGAEGVFRV